MRLSTLLFLFASLSLLMPSCASEQDANQKTTTTIDVPKLIDRSTAIQYGKEWENAQRFYMAQKLNLQANPNDYEARIKLAQLFITEARVTGEHGHYYPAALALVNKIIEDAPSGQDLVFQAMAIKAGVLLSLHEFGEALEVGQKAVVMNPYNAQIQGVLVDAYVELGMYSKAVEAADRMVNIRPDMRSYSRIAYLREIHGDIDGSKEALKLAVEAGYPGQEETAWAMLTLGEIYANYGDLDTAEQLFKAILSTRENYPFATAALGDIYYQKGDFVKAESTIKKAIDAIPEVGFYMQLATLYQAQDRDEEVKELIKEIHVMLEDDIQAGHNMSLEFVSLYRDLMKDPEGALKYALSEYEKRPSNIDVNRELANIYKILGETEKSQKHLQLASITQSKHPDLLAMQGE